VKTGRQFQAGISFPELSVYIYQFEICWESFCSWEVFARGEEFIICEVYHLWEVFHSWEAFPSCEAFPSREAFPSWEAFPTWEAFPADNNMEKLFPEVSKLGDFSRRLYSGIL
jgi:hypothetical protein